MTSLDQLRLQRAAEHLHRGGPRAVAELLADVARRIGGGPAIFVALNEHQRLNGGNRLPARPLHEVSR